MNDELQGVFYVWLFAMLALAAATVWMLFDINCSIQDIAAAIRGP